MTEPLDEPEAERLAKDRRIARGLRAAALRALRLARRYREEEGAGGARERACVAQALAWRSAARRQLVPAPGLARTTPVRAAGAKSA